MNKHKFRTAVLLSVILCFIIVSPVLIQGSSAYIFGQSPICRGSFYAEPGESSVPESSVPGSSVPESSVPESSVPESSIPESSVPKSSVPESSVPKSSIPESSVPEKSVPESSATTRTGDGTNTLPIIAMLLFSIIAIILLFAAIKRSNKRRNSND